MPHFDAEVNFGEATEQGQEIYFCLGFKNKNDKKEKNYLDISVSVETGAQAEIKGVLSPTSKALLGVSTVCLTAGIVIIAKSFIASNAKKQ